MRAVQLKNEITADSKTIQQGFTNAETEVVSVVTKTFEEKNSSAVDVEEIEPELSEAESTTLHGLQFEW